MKLQNVMGKDLKMQPRGKKPTLSKRVDRLIATAITLAWKEKGTSTNGMLRYNVNQELYTQLKQHLKA